jgi:hypothetical protein
MLKSTDVSEAGRWFAEDLCVSSPVVRNPSIVEAFAKDRQTLHIIRPYVHSNLALIKRCNPRCRRPGHAMAVSPNYAFKPMPLP